MNALNIYEIAIVCGGILSAGWLILIIGVRLCFNAWNWVDDKENKLHNPLIRLIMIRLGWEHYDGSWLWTKGDDKSDGAVAVFVPAGALLILPVCAAVTFEFYSVALTILTIVLLAHTARYARRHKKVFDSHVKDKAAHK